MINFNTLMQQAAEAAKLVSDLGKNIEAAKTALTTTELSALQDQYRQIHAKSLDLSAELDKALAEAEKG